MDKNVSFHFEKLEANSGYLLWQTSRLWQRNMNRALSDLGVTRTQFVIMAALAWLLKETTFVTQKDIAEHSNLDRMMVSKILRALQKNSLIERKEHSLDTRAKTVSLTVQGATLLQQVLIIVQAIDHKFFLPLANEDQFKQELGRIIK